MFTGIVQEIGTISGVELRAGAEGARDLRMEIAHGKIDGERLNLGDSICVDGVCLTVAERRPGAFIADVSAETLNVTTLGRRKAGDRVNLEPALRAGDSLGGHWVSGHVDGIAEVLAASEDARSLRVELCAPRELARFIARKGSVTLDGVSLTVNEVNEARFVVNLVPHTLAVTTLGALRPGTLLNIEIDLMARYVARLVQEGQMLPREGP
jgi:riboflavin synthase